MHFTDPQGYTFHVIKPEYKDHLCRRTTYCWSLGWSLYTSSLYMILKHHSQITCCSICEVPPNCYNKSSRIIHFICLLQFTFAIIMKIFYHTVITILHVFFLKQSLTFRFRRPVSGKILSRLILRKKTAMVANTIIGRQGDY